MVLILVEMGLISSKNGLFLEYMIRMDSFKCFEIYNQFNGIKRTWTEIFNGKVKMKMPFLFEISYFLKNKFEIN